MALEPGFAENFLKAACGSIESYKGHGVFVPPGMTAAQIMEGARVLEERFDVTPFTSRHMVVAVLEALANLQPEQPDYPERRERIMQELADQAQALGMGYDYPERAEADFG